jgi:antitoxin (DNA-binding transcriptional repressor) of toxin-antitoxin stability system
VSFPLDETAAAGYTCSMLHRFSVQEVGEHFEEYVHRVEDEGASVVLMRGGQPVAELRPVLKVKRLRELPQILASLPRLSEDEAASFSADLDAARAEIAGSPGNPWER